MAINIPDNELEWRFGTSGGPGGQHANRSNTRAELTYDVAKSSALTREAKERVITKLGSVIRVVEDGSRSQRRNRDVALQRLRTMVADAQAPGPPPRRPTRPSRRARTRRLNSKRFRSRLKENRRRPNPFD